MTHCNLPFSCDCSTTYPLSACTECTEMCHLYMYRCTEIYAQLSVSAIYRQAGVKLVKVANFYSLKESGTKIKNRYHAQT